MSQIPLLVQPKIPACRHTGGTVCAGPPTTLPHDIPLPADPDGVRTQQHYSGHHGRVGDSPATCGICAAIVKHINDCPPCQASLIRCIRHDDCGAAWNPFVHLIRVIAANLARRLQGLTPADVDEAREAAEEKGMVLVFTDPSFDPPVVVTGGHGRLTAQLWTAMWRKMLDHVRSSKPGTVFVVDPQPEGEGGDGTHGAREVTVLDTTAQTPGVNVAERDPTGDTVAHADAAAALNRLIVGYYHSCDEVNRFVFKRWYAKRVGGDGPTQEQISRDLLETLGVDEKQPQINRRITGFKKDLDQLIADPANGLDAETRTLARRLFVDNKRTRRGNRSPGSASAESTETTTGKPEDDDD